SMPYHFIAWYEALRPYGIRLSCFDVYAKEGERWEKTLRYFLRSEGIEPTAAILQKIFRRRQLLFRKYFKRFLFAGAAEVIGALKEQGYLLGLVTGTPLHDVREILPRRVYQKFDTIVTGDRVRHGKPHPEPYRTAARELKVEARDCIVIENAPLGIASAKGAGMFCVAVTTSLPKAYLTGADLTVTRLSDIGSLAGKLQRVATGQK
ncbi:MAG: HAD family phosphatase, partial [Candidatus Omnitrophota bacterium]